MLPISWPETRTPVRLSRGGCSRQFGRASVPMMPQRRVGNPNARHRHGRGREDPDDLAGRIRQTKAVRPPLRMAPGDLGRPSRSHREAQGRRQEDHRRAERTGHALKRSPTRANSSRASRSRLPQPPRSPTAPSPPPASTLAAATFCPGRPAPEVPSGNYGPDRRRLRSLRAVRLPGHDRKLYRT
jgi:hypothetical protein